MRPITFEWLTSFNFGLIKTRSSSGCTDIELALVFKTIYTRAYKPYVKIVRKTKH